MSSYHKGPAQIGLVIKEGSGLGFGAFNSIKEMVQHYLVHEAVEGFWGSKEHLDALEETKLLLDRTIAHLHDEVRHEDD